MPEIAEVETVRRTLKKMVLNQEIIKVKVLYPKIITNDIAYFTQNLIGQKIIDIKRRGKWLIFVLNDFYLLSHLRMEGKYFVKNKSDAILKHEHIIFEFKSGNTLRYHDTRKFGQMMLVLKEDINKIIELNKQGQEPLSKGLTKEYLYAKIKPRNVSIKTLLLDQSIISGLGNIYADEVLFLASINPLRKGLTLTLEECANIITASNKIIKKAILNGGTTIKSYTSSLGVKGRFQNYLMVHKQEGKPCKICHQPIKKIKINGRSTYFCSHCQK